MQQKPVETPMMRQYNEIASNGNSHQTVFEQRVFLTSIKRQF
jgi:hypothetical protein